MVLYLSSLNPKHFDEDVLLRLAFFVLSYFNARPYFPFSSLCLVISLLMQLSRYNALDFFSVGKSGGLKWTRTIDLALIRRAL